MRIPRTLILIMLAFFLNACGFLLGEKEDETVKEIFEDGAIDPEVNPSSVGYVPVLPYWTNVNAPIDVFVGYDEMVYVVDADGLKVFDQKGELHLTIPIQGAVEVTMDRRLHVYVAGRVDVDLCLDGSTENVAAVYHLANPSSGNIQFLDTLIHPICDVTRNSTCFRGPDDISVEFTGLTVLADNTLYVSRRGPRNDLTSIARPDNTILFFDEDGNNTGYAKGLNPVSSSLKSTLGVQAIAGFAGPPQRLNGMSTSREFLLLQNSPMAEYGALWIKRFEDPEAGVYFAENAGLVDQDLTQADRFLYQPNRFSIPSDIYVAPDFTGYIFLVDEGLDSLYQFTPKGYEGVNPPSTYTSKKQILASFGGYGSGPFEFKDPSGVCYYERTVFVADKGNNRIARFKLSTDLE